MKSRREFKNLKIYIYIYIILFRHLYYGVTHVILCLNILIIVQVHQKDSCIVPGQGFGSHFVRERSKVQDAGVRFHPQFLSSVE